MKKNSFETVLYSAIGVIALLLILVAFNAITGVVKQRVDLTKDKAYTLSAGTRAILQKLDTPVKIRFYYYGGEGGAQETVILKTYAQHVEDMLGEYKQAAKGKIILEKYEPKPDSDAEDSARLDGVEGQLLSNGEKFYLGLCVSMLDTKEPLPLLSPDRERLLEYDLSRAITRVVKPEKPVVGVMSPLPVFGTPGNDMMARMGQGGGQAPWTIINELKSDFTVKQVEMTADKIDDDIKVLVVIHPKDITDKAQYAIDQFVMRGGKLLAFLDATSLVSKQPSGNEMMGQLPGSGSSLDKLLKAWGIQFDSSKVAADLNYKMKIGGRNGQPTEAPGILSVTADGVNKDDIVTSEIDDVWLPYSGVFTGTPAEGLKETVLLKTTKDSQLVDGMMASLSGESIINEFKPSGIEYPLAIRLTGKFKTAFPNGKPEEKAADDKSAADKKPDQAGESLKETKSENAVVLFGDADMLYDEFALRQMQTPFGVITSLMNGNLTLAQNIIGHLAGDSNLISVRSRATANHPFTRIAQMDAQAETMYESKIKEFEDSQRETQQRISELQQNKEQGQRFILSPEQAAELKKLKEKAAEVNAQLKQEKKKLAHDKESLQNRLKWGNILGMPILVAFSGIGLAVFKQKRTSAK